MELAARTKLGPYEIVGSLGAGGMGEVYRARDVRLDRHVAIKILPSHFSVNPELKSRFEREARTLSSVSHPHICHLYDVGSQAGVEFLVMELLEGETLADRLRRGPLPFNELIRVATEIADALAKAHRLGVIHRDLKPSNIMLTKNGTKLMDFGLAKPAAAPLDGPFTGGATATLQSPAAPISSVGTVVGTIHYMAPEQLEGKDADARSDLFSFGAVLYEMATGKRAFEGKSHLSVASAILHNEPPPLRTVQPASSAALDYIIRICLAKDPDERFQTAQDLKLQLNCLTHAGDAVVPSPKKELSASQRKILFLLAAVILAALALMGIKLVNRPVVPAPAVTRFSIALPGKQELAVDSTQAVVLSPDGKKLAYVAADSGVSHLYVRRLDSFDAILIPDSEGTTFPFFSPNGEWIAFFSQGKLKKAPANGGNPVVVCELPTFFGGVWTPQDVMVLSVPSYGLATVPAGGGSPQKLAVATKENIYPQGPTYLVDDWVAFTDYFASHRSVVAVKLSTGELRHLANNAQNAYYAAGNLVYYVGGTMWAAPFDIHKLAIVGDAKQIASDVNEQNYVAQASASTTGVLAYAPGLAGNFTRNLFWVDRHGIERKIDIPAADFVDPAISPDGKRVAIASRRVGDQQLSVFERDTSAMANFVADGSLNASPVWMPDGKSLIFDSYGPSHTRGIYRIAADGRSAPELIRETSLPSHVTAIAGEYAAVTVNDPTTSTDVWLLKLGDHNEMQPFKRTAAAERQGSLSPDSHWLAYVSNESGRSEVYVEPLPGPGGRWQISIGGGEQPRWVRNGREIVFRNGTKMMSVALQTQPTFQAGKPLELFDRKFDRGGAVAGYDVTPDGQAFVMTRSEHASPTEIRVVMDWPGERQTAK